MYHTILMTALIIIIIILLVFGGYIVAVYNSLIAMIEAVRNNNKQIDIQLDRRYKVFESLVNVVKKYMDYEKSTLKEVVALRNQAQVAKQSGDAQTRMDAENKISGILSGLNVVFEQYPDLKANQNALQLQESIVSTENKLAYAKQAYNDSIERYNAKKKSFFPSMIVSFFSSKLNFDFPYWQLSADAIKKQEDYTVNL
ncbi:LemA family protein [Candidiatus Paracoxiella cheracis]|uniref:LemA family protein n=1 Tax=Candidiatus Paracoxiella cheracis TaxID=3405120 RepID=UPI003BF566B7